MDLPDRGQPLDINYLLRMASEINTLSATIDSRRSQSSIKYFGESGATNVSTSELVVYASSQSVTGNSTSDSGLTTRFDYSFRRAPIVTVSAQSSSDNVYCVIKSVSDRSCEVKLILPAGTTSSTTANISIIAIGEKV
jgi:hypothetical protein